MEVLIVGQKEVIKLLGNMKKLLIAVVLMLILVSCNQNKNLSKEEIATYTIKGKEIAKESFNALSSLLMQQMKEGGTEQALPFCNTQASPIINNINQKYNVIVKRTSLKIRNENNNPTSEEAEILKNYAEFKKGEEKLTPLVNLDENGNPHFYAPIILKENCMVCHGNVGENVTIKTDSIIKSLYPKDKATGFKTGDLRGIWSITFNN